MLPCPSVDCTSGSVAPRSMAWLACAWRDQCGDTGVSRPARVAARLTRPRMARSPSWAPVLRLAKAAYWRHRGSGAKCPLRATDATSAGARSRARPEESAAPASAYRAALNHFPTQAACVAPMAQATRVAGANMASRVCVNMLERLWRSQASASLIDLRDRRCSEHRARICRDCGGWRFRPACCR
jgi:hypothetical protein